MDPELLHGVKTTTNTDIIELRNGHSDTIINILIHDTHIHIQDINDRIAVAIPQLYNIGISGSLYTMQKFWVHIAYGIYESLIAFFFGYIMYNEASTSPNGYDSGQEVMGNCVAFLLIISINIVMAVNTYNWSIMTVGSLVLTLVIWIGFVFYYASSSTSLTYGIIPRLFGEPAFYFITPIYFVLALAPRYIKKYIQVTYLPNDVDIIREVNKYHIRIPDLPDNYEFDDEAYREKLKKKEKKREERRKARELYWKRQKETLQKMVNILTPQPKFSSLVNMNTGTADQVGQEGVSGQNVVPTLQLNHQELSPNDILDDNSSQHSTLTKKSKLFPSNVRTPTFTSPGTTTEEQDGFYGNDTETAQQKYIYNVMKNQVLMKVMDKHFPKLRIKDLIHSSSKAKPSNMGIVFMNDEKIVSNTGFCYSQESGMKEIITPSGNENILPMYETMKGGERTEWDNTIPKYKNFRRTRSLNDSYSHHRSDRIETRRYRTYQNNTFSKSVDNFEYHRRYNQAHSFKSPVSAQSTQSSFFGGNSSTGPMSPQRHKGKGKGSEY